jgi:hypothetical protein
MTMQNTYLAHLAGLFDGCATISAEISKDEDYALGYRYKPRVRLHLPMGSEPTIGKFDEFAEDRSIKYNVFEMGNSQVIETFDIGSIERMLIPLMEYMTVLYDSSLVMLDKIIPELKHGQPESREKFIELVGYADGLRKASRHQRESKYDREYFEELWGVEV